MINETPPIFALTHSTIICIFQTQKKSRWSETNESVKGVSVGKGLSSSKFKMIQCKDCNVFLSNDEQYKEVSITYGLTLIYLKYSRGLAERGQEEEQENEQH